LSIVHKTNIFLIKSTSIKELFPVNRCLEISKRDLCNKVRNKVQGGMRMKKFLVVLVLGVMVFGFGSALLAATDTSNIQVTVAAIDVLDVTDGGTITLNTVNGANLTGTSDTTARLSYTHNTGTKHITAEVLPAGLPSGQTITLTAAVAGGDGTKTLVTAGAASGAQTVMSGIAVGAISNAVVTYGAQCTIAGTPANTYTFTVTYTSIDG
jgi:hypothetical protein